MRILLSIVAVGMLLTACCRSSETVEPPTPEVYTPYGDPGYSEADGATKDDAQLAPLLDLGYDAAAIQADEASYRRLITLSKYLGHEREAWQKPAEVIAALGVQPGQTVADVGSASGYFAWYLSEAVGTDGQVLAVDVDAVACDFIERRLKHQPPPHGNVRVVHSRVDRVALGLESIDHALLVDAEFFVIRDDNTRGCLRSLFAAMKPGGKVAVIESKQKAERGEVTETMILEPFVEAGFIHLETLDLLSETSFRRPGGQHFLVFERAQ